MRGKAVCRTYGGASTGPKTQQGRERSAQAKTIHGWETREIRRKRATGRGKKNLTSRYRITGGAQIAATVGQNMPPNHKYKPSAIDDLAMSIEIMGGE